jgi:hypothetical protein
MTDQPAAPPDPTPEYEPPVVEDLAADDPLASAPLLQSPPG